MNTVNPFISLGSASVDAGVTCICRGNYFQKDNTSQGLCLHSSSAFWLSTSSLHLCKPQIKILYLTPHSLFSNLFCSELTASSLKPQIERPPRHMYLPHSSWPIYEATCQSHPLTLLWFVVLPSLLTMRPSGSLIKIKIKQCIEWL